MNKEQNTILKKIIKESIQDSISWDEVFGEFYSHIGNNKSIMDQPMKFIKWLTTNYKVPQKK